MPTQAVRAAAASTVNQRLCCFAELMAYFGRVGEPGDPAVANALLRAWIAQRKGKTMRGDGQTAGQWPETRPAKKLPGQNRRLPHDNVMGNRVQ
ncbi:MAG: hypothetical protein P8189_24335 [Anaerolineae bacterium]